MKQVIHSKFKPMKREPLFVALSNQKGGVGKSTAQHQYHAELGSGEH